MAVQKNMGPWCVSLLAVSLLLACRQPDGATAPEAAATPAMEISPRSDPRDVDGDGVHSLAFGGEDCDDTDPTVFPGAEERSGDAVDQDCDGRERCFRDLDGDGHGSAILEVLSPALACDPVGLSPWGDDCDETRAQAYPGAPESTSCAVRDNNCDGETAWDAATCRDADGDLFASVEDCDDRDPAVNPEATELCGDDIDQDCDGLSDIEEEACEFDTIGCEGSAFHDLSEGVAYAVEHGLSGVFVCAGDYEETDTVQIDAAFVLDGDRERGGVRLRSSAATVISISPEDLGRVRLEGLAVECASRSVDGVSWGPPLRASGAGLTVPVIELADVYISGCDIGFWTYQRAGITYGVTVTDSVISNNNQGVAIGSGVEASFTRVIFSENDDTGAVELWSREGEDYDLYFESCAFVDNHTDTGGAALDLTPSGNATGSIANVVLQDCGFTGNTSNAADWNGGSGAIQMYFREDDQPTVTMYGGSITENASILGESASGIHFYTGSFAGYDVDFGLGATENLPVDVDGLGFRSWYRFDTAATFYCESSRADGLHCEE